jgi:flagellar motor switch protein FliM
MVVTSSEIVVVVTLQVLLGETARDLYLVYPYSLLEPIKEKLYSGLVSDHVDQDGDWNHRFKDRLQDCPLPIVVRLGTATVTVKDVMNFSPGDVILLDQHPGDPLDCYIEGYHKFQGSPGVYKGNQACRVTKVLS